MMWEKLFPGIFVKNVVSMQCIDLRRMYCDANQKYIYIKISVGSRRRSKLFHFSLSTLETKEENFNILFLLSKLEKCIWHFSFSSRKLRIFFLISLSLLETGEREFRFLFLLSKLEKFISNFSFSSRNCDREFRFLFLLSKWEKLF